MTLTIPDIAFSPKETKTAGRLLNTTETNSIPARISPNSTASFYPGTAVKLVSSDSFPIIEKALATDKIFGYIMKQARGGSGNGTTKNNKAFVAGDMTDVALMDPTSRFSMIAGGDITAGDLLEIVPSTDKVIKNAGVNSIAGKALVNASNNQIIDVLLITTTI